MPTKPSTTFTFATNANYTVGPFIGSATKVIPGDIPNGFVPATGVVAEHANYMHHWSGAWITDWLDQGSSANDVDAHIVETNSQGRASVAAATIGNSVSPNIALTVWENSGAPSFTIYARNDSGNNGIYSYVNGGTGVPITCVQSGGTGAGGSFTTTTNGNAIQTEANGTGHGAALLANGSGHGAYCVADGTGSGVKASRVPTAGPAGEFVQDGGATPVRGIIHCEPTAAPSAPVEGDLYIKGGAAGFGRGGIYEYDDDGASGGGSGGWQKAWTTAGGHGYLYASDEGDDTESAGVLTTKLTVNLDSSGSPGNGQGKYLVNMCCNVRLAGGAAVATRAWVEFHDDGGVFDEVEMDFAALGQRKTISTIREVTLGVPVVPLTIKFKTMTAGNGVIISRARISAQGAHE